MKIIDINGEIFEITPEEFLKKLDKGQI